MSKPRQFPALKAGGLVLLTLAAAIWAIYGAPNPPPWPLWVELIRLLLIYRASSKLQDRIYKRYGFD